MRRCLKKCEALTDAGTDEPVLPVLDSKQQNRLQGLMKVDFNDNEKDKKVLDAIAYCAEGPPKTDKFFFAKPRRNTDVYSHNNSRKYAHFMF